MLPKSVRPDIPPPNGVGSRASSPGGTGEYGTRSPKSFSSGALERACSAPTRQITDPPELTKSSMSWRSAGEKALFGPIKINRPQRSNRSAFKSGVYSGRYPWRISVRNRPATP